MQPAATGVSAVTYEIDAFGVPSLTSPISNGTGFPRPPPTVFSVLLWNSMVKMNHFFNPTRTSREKSGSQKTSKRQQPQSYSGCFSETTALASMTRRGFCGYTNLRIAREKGLEAGAGKSTEPVFNNYFCNF